MDFFMDKITWLLNKFSAKIPSVTIPWNKFNENMQYITPHLEKANTLFPVDVVLSILILWGLLRVILLIIWIVTFIRKMLPF